MATDPWQRATFTGNSAAQADELAVLTTDQRLRLLEQLLELAESNGALQRSRADKQAAIDALWTTTVDVSSRGTVRGDASSPRHGRVTPDAE